MNLTAEWSLARKLTSLDPQVNIFSGMTTYEGRKAGSKAVIERLGPEIVFTVRDGKQITLAKQWSLTYSQDWNETRST